MPPESSNDINSWSTSNITMSETEPSNKSSKMMNNDVVNSNGYDSGAENSSEPKNIVEEFSELDHFDNANDYDAEKKTDDEITRNATEEINLLSRQFPGHKEDIIRMREEFPDLLLDELRALLLTEIQETPFSSHRVPPTPMIQPKPNRLVQTLRNTKTPKKVSNPFNKLVVRHQKQIGSSSPTPSDSDGKETKAETNTNEYPNNNKNIPHMPTISSIPNNSLSDESFMENGAITDLQQPCIQMVNPSTGHQEWRLVQGLENEVLKELTEHDDVLYQDCTSPFSNDQICTKVFIRDPNVGLGMTIRENNGYIYVHALVCQDGTRLFGKEEKFEQMMDGYIRNGLAGPAQAAGVCPGDRILGLNGKAFLPFKSGEDSSITPSLSTSGSSSGGANAVSSVKGIQRQRVYPASSTEILRNAAKTIMNTPDPVVLHVCPTSIDLRGLELEINSDSFELVESMPDKIQNGEIKDQITESSESSSMSQASIGQKQSSPKRAARPIPAVHPFAKALTKRGLLQSGSDESIVTMQLNTFTARTRQWENTSYLRVDRIHNNKLLPDNGEIPPQPNNSQLRSHLLYTPSTPPSDEQITTKLRRGIYPGKVNDVNKDAVYIPLTGIRKSLCVRIVNTFVAEDRTAYTLWVYDIELGQEWYAPVRYYRDFKDLRSETSYISATIGQLPFPTDGWKVFGASEVKESETAKANRCRQLERFLKTLCGIVYTGNIHPRLQEVAVHLQSFLGCDTGLDDTDNNIVLERHVAINSAKFIRKMKDNPALTSIQDIGLLLLLKRSIQRYTNRIFLLPMSEQLVSQFIDGIKSNIPSSSQMNAIKKKNRNSLKENAQTNLNRVRDFLNQIHALIMDGATDDLNALSRRSEYDSLSQFFDSSDGTHKIAFFSDSVREQVEIEIYIPLRSSISKYLVNGWRNDDLEMKFKMQELKKRPQSYFKIKPEHQSPSEWDSVSKILNMGVGLSSLPCEKLQAIIDAAKEVSRLYDEEHNKRRKHSIDSNKVSGNESRDHPSKSESEKEKTLGADDFLPIFIFCVVRAELERPCAISALLKTLCAPSKRIGEMGYYLATFEAAISHIGDMDLSEDYSPEDRVPLL